MKIMVTGGKGQLGMDCVRVFRKACEVASVDLDEADITQLSEVERLVHTFEPDIILNCAAYTHVDNCETEKDLAWRANVKGSENIAFSLNKRDGLMIHISSDYVFNGEKGLPEPYVETDHPHPISYYGITKYESEQIVKRTIDRYVIVRTAWMYGISGNNFLKTILKLALKHPERQIKVVNDQFGSPTWSHRLALQISKIIEANGRGVYHATSAGHCSWYELATYFLQKMNVTHTVIPCTTEQYPTAAKRPKNSILENRHLKAKGINIMPDWRDDVDQFIANFRDRLLNETT
ncbi:MAG: dTDP-4-dehydrorhamnose reductase [Desulfobacterales bacterium]|nr:MAG: dTDP-4-dehydrorhamnose reductase [Desulfobacterales bacterium]UCD90581.1 MAG: dTDP-4-dehydrorhamnose reductase [Desulfobacterales bacterium]